MNFPPNSNEKRRYVDMGPYVEDNNSLVDIHFGVDSWDYHYSPVVVQLAVVGMNSLVVALEMD